MRRTGTEICIDNIEMEDGYERFLGIWDEIKDEFKG